MNSKDFWYTLMAGSIGLWITLILTATLVPSMAMISSVILIALTALHIIEFPLASKKISADKGISGCTAFIKTLLFGFTWWLALKKGIVDK